MDVTNFMHLVQEISHNIFNSILGGNVILIFTDWMLYKIRLVQISTRAQIILSFYLFYSAPPSNFADTTTTRPWTCITKLFSE
jgi:hypothetical protein